MRFPRGSDVPVTSGVSGLVFVLALFSISTPVRELALFTAWGLVYAVEIVVRRRRGAARSADG